MNDPGARSWLERHWKWIVPVACLVASLGFLGSIIAAVALFFGAMRSSDACSYAVDQARRNREVAAALGEPLAPGWLVTGTIKVSGPSGTAELAIPLHGSRNSGTLYVIAQKRAGRWEYHLLEVEVKGRSGRINLLRGLDAPVSNNPLKMSAHLVTALARARSAPVWPAG